MKTWLLSLACLAALPAGASPLAARQCVVLRALPAEADALFAQLADVQTRAAAAQSLREQGRANGANADELESLLASQSSDDAPAWTEARARQLAADGFAHCARRLLPTLPDARLQACATDLDSLPVLLLYRVDGLRLAQARQDLQERGELADGSADAQRLPYMLNFAYQGPAPAAGEQGRHWIDQRMADWTARCLSAQIKGLQP